MKHGDGSMQRSSFGGSTEILLFLACGGFSAGVNVVGRYILTPILGFGASVVVAYVIGMVVAYTLFRTFVFGRSGMSIASETFRFVIVNIVALAFVWLCSMSLAFVLLPAIGWTWYVKDTAHVIGVCAPAITSYIGHAKFTFRKD